MSAGSNRRNFLLYLNSVFSWIRSDRICRYAIPSRGKFISIRSLTIHRANSGWTFCPRLNAMINRQTTKGGDALQMESKDMHSSCLIVGKKVKFSHTRYRVLGLEMIPLYRQSACRWLFKSSPVVDCHYFPPYLWSPSQPKNVTVLWPMPSYTAWLQRHIGVNNLPEVATQLSSRWESNPRPDRKFDDLPLSHCAMVGGKTVR